MIGGDGVSYGSRPRDAETWREAMLAETGLRSPRLHFLGHVPYKRYVSALSVSSAHVYLTYPFTLSWSMLEAMALGCLVVGSDTAPVREVIEDGVNGLLVDFFSPDEIAEKIGTVLREPKAFAPIRKAARETIVADYALADCLPRQVRLVKEMAMQSGT